jgi:hypothetical protein
MNADRWKVTKGLFQRAIQLPPEQWPAYLDAVCAGDQELRGHVVSLLAEHVPYDGALRARLSSEAAALREVRVTRSDEHG